MGAKRWLTIGPINFQPSEVAKLSLIIYFAYSMERDGKKMNKFSVGIMKNTWCLWGSTLFCF